jgi:hypothetical protein
LSFSLPFVFLLKAPLVDTVGQIPVAWDTDNCSLVPRKETKVKSVSVQQQVLARMRGKRNPLTLLVGM